MKMARTSPVGKSSFGQPNSSATAAVASTLSDVIDVMVSTASTISDKGAGDGSLLEANRTNGDSFLYSSPDNVTEVAAEWPYALPKNIAIKACSGILLSISIVVFSAPPAATIWRNDHLHRASYYYVMIICLLDCTIGLTAITMSVLAVASIVVLGGVSGIICCGLEVIINGCMNATNLLMLTLGRDRYLSVRDPLKYPLMVTPSVVWRHLKIALLYGGLHGAAFTGARTYYGALLVSKELCDSFDWLLSPNFRLTAFFTVASNIFLDLGTVYYNAKVMHCAWKVGVKTETAFQVKRFD